jgi:hypothetical protein
MSTKINQLGVLYNLPMTPLIYFNPYVELLFWTIELVISYCQMVHLFMHLPISYLQLEEDGS